MITIDILFADDDHDDHKFFEEYLQHCPMDVTIRHFYDGEQALDYLKKNDAPDFIIADWNMPKMSGDELLLFCRSSQFLQDIPLFLFSTGAKDNMKQNILDKGADGLLQKPSTVEGWIRFAKNICDIALKKKEERTKFWSFD